MSASRIPLPPTVGEADAGLELEALYRNAPLGLCLLDRELRYVRCNARLAEMNGRGVAEHIGRTVREVIPDHAARLEPTLRAVIDRGEPVLNLAVVGEMPSTPGVQRAWIADYLPVRDGRGEVVGIQAIIREVTAERHAADELGRRAALLDLSSDAIMVRDVDGTIRYWSLGSERLYGFPASLAVGCKAQELLDTRWPGSRDEVQRQLLESGAWSGELVQRAANGAEVVVLTRLLLVAADGGAATEVLESGTDITHRKADERRLRDAHAAAERASTAKSDFVAMMSHELRTPLQAIMSATELLAPDPERPGTPIQLRHIAFATQSMARLVDDLLDMARLERSRLPLDWRVTSLRELLRRVLEPLEARARSRGLAFRVAVATDVPRRIRTDPVRFGQVLSNVVDNAIKFTAEGTIEVDVRRGDDGRALVAQVSDTGVGISAEWHATIFEPFAQATPGQRSGHGVGLGLAIAAELVRSMGGRIEVQSAPGCGSTFRVTLPLEEMAE